MATRRLCALFLIAALLSARSSPALADGKYFGRTTVALEPGIPHQSAVISFRDGVQTLVVQSTVNAEGDEVGWILPLPAEPTAIEAATPGTIATMHQLVQPALITSEDIEPWLGLATAAAINFAIMLLAACIVRRTRTPAWRVVQYAVALPIVAFLVLGTFLPTLTRPRSNAAAPLIEAGARILMHETVGSYDVTVLTAESGAEVRDWLTSNGFACDEAAVKTLDAYVQEGWCFAAAKIRWSEDGTLTPHPLKVVFPVAEAVYPMRLTGVGATQALALDLFIVGEEMAEAEGLGVWRCESLAHETFQWDGPIDQYAGESTRLRIGHPQITSLLWDGAVLTHLSGSLSSREMAARDVAIAWRPAEPMQRKFYTEAAASVRGWTAMLGTLALSLFVTSLLTLRRETPGRRIVRAALLPGLAVSVVAGVMVGTFTPSVPTNVDMNGWDRIDAAHRVMFAIEAKDYKPESSAAAYINMLLHDPPRHLVRGDVPDGVVIKEDEAGWTVIVHDRDATPQTYRVAKAEGG